MEDIRQPLDNPYLETDYKILAKEVAKYRAIAADRAQREEEALAKKVLATFWGERGNGLEHRMESSVSVRSETCAVAVPCITRFTGKTSCVPWIFVCLWQERIHLDLRLLSGERRHGNSRVIAKSYEELQQAFLEVLKKWPVF